MVRGSLLAVHGPRHVHAAGHGVDAEDLHGRLVRAHARDAVADGDVVVFVGADLEGGAGGGASGLGVPRRCWEPRVGVLRDLPCAHQAVGRPRHRVLNDAPWGVRRAAGTHCLAGGWGWGWGWAGALRRPRPRRPRLTPTTQPQKDNREEMQQPLRSLGVTKVPMQEGSRHVWVRKPSSLPGQTPGKMESS